MPEVIGVRFRSNERIQYFDAKNKKYSKGQFVVTQADKGYNCGIVVVENKEVIDDTLASSLKQVIREADSVDLKKLKQNKIREKDAKKLFQKKVRLHNLKMKLIDVDCLFYGNKVLFYFTADGRVDFRNLVKDLAASLHARIELRQIGVRDEARMIGGLGSCGKPFCCSTFLDDFHSVSIKMAKEQGLSLNPTKISGTCGRLMCCLKFEQVAYNDLLKGMPKVGAIVDTQQGRGSVIENNVLTGNLKVCLDENPSAMPLSFKVNEVKIIKNSSIKINKDEIEKLKDLE